MPLPNPGSCGLMAGFILHFAIKRQKSAGLLACTLVIDSILAEMVSDANYPLDEELDQLRNEAKVLDRKLIDLLQRTP